MKGENEMEKQARKYVVYWVGGEKDGETLREFDTELKAIEFAKEYRKEHEDEFDPTWGGTGIVRMDDHGNEESIEW